MYCSQCGKQSPQGAKFCINCGTGFSATSFPSSGHTAEPETHIFETREKNNHRNKTWLVVAAGIIVIGAAAYFIFTSEKKQKKDQLATTPTTVTPTEAVPVPGDYPIASTRELKQEEILNLTAEEMKKMRNEIYARHGYIFQNQEMLAHFSKMPWYKGEHTDVRNMLTPLERKNIELIKEMEKYNDDHGYDFGR